jgi:hypothetical protein
MGSFTHKCIVARSWCWKSVPSCWLERQCVRECPDEDLMTSSQPFQYPFISLYIFIPGRRSRVTNAGIRPGIIDSHWQVSLPFLLCAHIWAPHRVSVNKDRVGCEYTTGNGYHSRFPTLIRTHSFLVMSYSHFSKLQFSYGHNTVALTILIPLKNTPSPVYLSIFVFIMDTVIGCGGVSPQLYLLFKT